MRLLPFMMAMLLPALTSACALQDTTSKNDWLANAPEYSQQDVSGDTSSELADVGAAQQHTHSGHR